MKKILLFALTALTLVACNDNIDVEHRFSKEPISFQPKKNVLVEDFTGQKCINCPLAAQALHSIQHIYGEDHVIGVAVHGGGFQLPIPFDNPYNLATEFGNTLQTQAGVENWPIGRVDRGGLSNYSSWSAQVVQQLQQTTPATLSLLGTHFEAQPRTAKIHLMVNSTQDDTWQLNIWLTEDSIYAYQMLPNGQPDRKYLHQHVLRTSLTPLEGETIKVQANNPLNIERSLPLAERWKEKNLYVVAFVTNAKGVLQVIRYPLITPHVSE